MLKTGRKLLHHSLYSGMLEMSPRIQRVVAPGGFECEMRSFADMNTALD